MERRHRRGTISAHRMPWAALPGLIGILTLCVACAPMHQTVRCPKGQTLSNGQCIPTPALVFARCIDAFRKTTVEVHSGKTTQVGVRADRYGAAQVQHANQDLERAEYSGVPESLLNDALAECRRQEEQERAQQIERAWAQAQAERDRAETAQRAADDAEVARTVAAANAEQLGEALAASQATVQTLQEALDALAADREQERAALGATHPCAVQDWARCGEQALSSKRAGDHVRAHALFSEACTGGDAKACANWGVMFEQGLGIEADPVAAHDRYAQGCRLGSAEACTSEGIAVLQGRGTPRDARRAAQLLHDACQDDVGRACARLGRMVELGSTGAPTARNAAGTLYADACELGDPQGCLWLGDWVRRPTQDAPADLRRAAQAYARACDAQEAEGCLRLAALRDGGAGEAGIELP